MRFRIRQTVFAGLVPAIFDSMDLRPSKRSRQATDCCDQPCEGTDFRARLSCKAAGAFHEIRRVRPHGRRRRAARPVVCRRLALVEAYDRAGIYGYHLAEHHATPLGWAASPSLFLAAVAQRTSRLRFGPLVYLLPFYHPLRLIEEICMLDQMSGGRLLLGVGRGVSPFETEPTASTSPRPGRSTTRRFQVLLQGLACDELTFEGDHYQFDKVPMMLRPVQRPHPPLWYGTTIPENADWPAANDVNIVTIGLRPTVRTITDRYRAVRAKARQAPGEHPLIGVARHVVVAETDEEALAIARRAYPRWRAASAGCSSAMAPRRGSATSIRDLRRTRWRSRTASPVRRATVRDFVAAEIAGDRQSTTCYPGSRSAT